MLLDVALGNKSAWRVLALYGESPGAGFTRQELRNHTKLGNKALSLALDRLLAFGILLKVQNEYPYSLYKLNQDDLYVEIILTLLNNERKDLNNLPYEFGRIAREYSREILDEGAKRIYLFGSVAKGTYRKDSDIDFALVVEKKNPKIDMIITGIDDKYSERFSRKIQSFVISEDDFANRKGIVDEVLKHGIRLV